MIAAVALTLILSACGATTVNSGQKQAISAPRTPTAMPTPPHLSWRAVTLPAKGNANDVANGVATAVSPVNGRHAWVCASSDGATFLIWFTKDAAATWQMVSVLTSPAAGASCSLTADQGDSNAIAANFAWGTANASGGGTQGSQSYYSTDDGAHWTAMRPELWIAQVITVGSSTYASLLDTSAQADGFVVSADRLASWHGILQPTQNTHPQYRFWAASVTGELLWADTLGGGAQWSDDGGASWGGVPPPSPGQIVQTTLATWQAQSSDWLVCGYVAGATQGPAENLCTSGIGGSFELGKVWSAYPSLTDTWECGHCAQGGGPSSGVHSCLASAMASDGTLYSVCGNDPQDSGTPPTPWTISRLTPGASIWATVGLAPCQNITLTQTGQAWCVDPVNQSLYMLDQLP